MTFGEYLSRLAYVVMVCAVAWVTLIILRRLR